MNFHLISTYFFNVVSLIGKSTSLPRATYCFRCNLAGRKSTLFPCTFFHVMSMVKKSTFFSRTFFDVLLLVEKSKLFPCTFSDVISMVKKSMLFPLTYFDVISVMEISALFLPLSVSSCFYLFLSTFL